MRSPLESQLKAQVERRLKSLAAADPTLVFRKRHGSIFTVAGDPDIHGVWNGTPFEIELKRPGEQPTKLQLLRMAQWHNAGTKVFVVHNLTEFDAAIHSLQKNSM